jgi:hypothetical protein
MKGKIVTDPKSPEERRRSMIDKVRGLLAMADDGALDQAAADNYREKADQLMVQYQLEEEEIRAAGGKVTDNIGHRTIFLFKTEVGNQAAGRNKAMGSLASYYLQYFFTLARHQNCQYTYDNVSNYERRQMGEEKFNEKYPQGDGWYGEVFGYESDLDMLEMIYLQVQLHMIGTLEPNVKNMERGAAIKALHDAGVQFPRIAQIIGVKYTAANIHRPYRDECRRLGEEMTPSAKNSESYRFGVAEGFSMELSRRVWEIESRRREWAREQDKDRGDGSSLAVLGDRADAVREAFYEAYPHLRPEPLDPNAAKAEPCPKCARAKSGRCRAHTFGKIRYVNIDPRGEAAGRAAAQKIDLGATRVSDRGSAKGIGR